MENHFRTAPGKTPLSCVGKDGDQHWNTPITRPPEINKLHTEIHLRHGTHAVTSALPALRSSWLADGAYFGLLGRNAHTISTTTAAIASATISNTNCQSFCTSRARRNPTDGPAI